MVDLILLQIRVMSSEDEASDHAQNIASPKMSKRKANEQGGRQEGSSQKMMRGEVSRLADERGNKINYSD